MFGPLMQVVGAGVALQALDTMILEASDEMKRKVKLLGEQAAALMRVGILANQWGLEPNTDATAMVKGHNLPLVDSATMVQSITSKLGINEENKLSVFVGVPVDAGFGSMGFGTRNYPFSPGGFFHSSVQDIYSNSWSPISLYEMAYRHVNGRPIKLNLPWAVDVVMPPERDFVTPAAEAFKLEYADKLEKASVDIIKKLPGMP